MSRTPQAEPKPSDVLVVSLLTRVRWISGRLEISAAGGGDRLVASDVDAVAVLHAFAEARSLREVQAALPGIHPSDLVTVVSQLRSADVLVTPAVNDEIASRHWDGDSLAFHRGSRAAYGTRGPQPVSPAVVAAPRGAAPIVLDRWPDLTGSSFRSILGGRVSRRSWRPEPMPNGLFGEFLWLSAHNRAGGDPADAVSRPYPSGGAAYSLELYPVLAPRSVAGIRGGVYRYLPGTHALETVATRSEDYVPLLRAAAEAADAGGVPVAILITSRFDRVSSAYGELAYSLVLTEAGGLLQTMYLVAEYLELAACAIGGGPLDGLVSEVIGAPDLVEPVVGQLVVGLRAG